MYSRAGLYSILYIRAGLYSILYSRAGLNSILYGGNGPYSILYDGVGTYSILHGGGSPYSIVNGGSGPYSILYDMVCVCSGPRVGLFAMEWGQDGCDGGRWRWRRKSLLRGFLREGESKNEGGGGRWEEKRYNVHILAIYV